MFLEWIWFFLRKFCAGYPFFLRFDTMLPLSASRVSFRLNPEVDSCLSQWEALLLWGFGLLRRDYSSLSENVFEINKRIGLKIKMKV